MHSRVFLTIDSFMVHDNPRPRNQRQKSKVDWCLETDHNSRSIRDKPKCVFQGWKMHLPGAFYRRLSWALSVSRNLRLYTIFIKESHRNTRVFSKIKRASRLFPTSPQHRDTCPKAFWRAGLMHSDSSPCKFRADLVLCRSKRRGYGSSKAHPNAFIEAAKMYLAMLPLFVNTKNTKVCWYSAFCVRGGLSPEQTR